MEGLFGDCSCKVLLNLLFPVQAQDCAYRSSNLFALDGKVLSIGLTPKSAADRTHISKSELHYRSGRGNRRFDWKCDRRSVGCFIYVRVTAWVECNFISQKKKYKKIDCGSDEARAGEGFGLTM